MTQELAVDFYKQELDLAVADAKVASYSEAKIRKESLDRVDLAKNPDILKLLSANKKKVLNS